jgi:succinate dehydrogenase / fumarate reductase cytochrome b subunit
MFSLMPSQSYRPFRSSIIKKQVMALTGLMMCGFLVVHLAGNLLLFKGPQVFNQYAFLMLTNPVIGALEWLLAGLFIIHALFGIALIVQNRRARPTPYAVRSTLARGSSISFLSMSITGPLLLVFLILHLLDFRFGAEHTIEQGGLVMRDLYRSVVEFYQNPWQVAAYMLAMGIVALHIQHGFWSAFQTFGVNHPRYNGIITFCASAFAVLMLVGFAVIPLYFFLAGSAPT